MKYFLRAIALYCSICAAAAFKENSGKVRKASWISPDSFANTPNTMKKLFGTPHPATLYPNFRIAGSPLAKQQTASGEEHPFILARPRGKGMVVLTGDLHGSAGVIENLLEYNKVIKHNKNGEKNDEGQTAANKNQLHR